MGIVVFAVAAAMTLLAMGGWLLSGKMGMKIWGRFTAGLLTSLVPFAIAAILIATSEGGSTDQDAFRVAGFAISGVTLLIGALLFGLESRWGHRFR